MKTIITGNGHQVSAELQVGDIISKHALEDIVVQALF